MPKAPLNHMAAKFLHGEVHIVPFELRKQDGNATWVLQIHDVLNNIISGDT